MTKTNTYVDGINKNTYELLFYDKITNEFKSDNLEKVKATFFIDMRTMSKNKLDFFTKFIKWNFQTINKGLSLNSGIYFDKKRKQLVYRSDDLVIYFSKLSDCVKLNDYLVNELHSFNRRHKCHSISIELVNSISETKLVTGHTYLDGKKILHSVVELSVDDEAYILDWGKNLIIKKEDYVNLIYFEEISSYDYKAVEEDIAMKKYDFFTNLKPYVLFRDELMQDLDKNKFLFEKPIQRTRKDN